MRFPIVGGDPRRIDVEASTALIRQAVARGVNYFDTAWIYHGGESERFVGQALREWSRERLYIATKSPVWEIQRESDWERILDLQLKKLGSDYVDFYLLHALSGERWDIVRRFNGLKCMERALLDGRVRHLGFSYHGTPTDFAPIIDAYDWHFCQIQYNFLDENYQAGTAGLRAAWERRVGVISMEPLRGGTLAVAPNEEVASIWNRHPTRRSAAEWALRWVLDKPEIVTALSGMGTMDQVNENIDVAETAVANSLSSEERTLIAEARDVFHGRMKTPCTTCGYCLPCPHGVPIPDVLGLYNSAAMRGDKSSASRFYRLMYAPRGQGGDACVACGVCETRCPQKIEISARLRDAHEYLAEG